MADGKVIAMKVQPQIDQRQMLEVKKEVQLLHKLRHPNIVSFFADFQFKTARATYICIAMEFCGGGTLQGHIRDRRAKGFSAFRIFGYLAQLADGLGYIHSQGVTHRDLKSENIMLTAENNLKISDFGCGKTMPEGAQAAFTMTGGDLMVIPPEFSAIAHGYVCASACASAHACAQMGACARAYATLSAHTHPHACASACASAESRTNHVLKPVSVHVVVCMPFTLAQRENMCPYLCGHAYIQAHIQPHVFVCVRACMHDTRCVLTAPEEFSPTAFLLLLLLFLRFPTCMCVCVGRGLGGGGGLLDQSACSLAPSGCDGRQNCLVLPHPILHAAKEV